MGEISQHIDTSTNEGVEASRLGMDRKDCPYKYESSDWMRWNRGFSVGEYGKLQPRETAGKML